MKDLQSETQNFGVIWFDEVQMTLVKEYEAKVSCVDFIRVNYKGLTLVSSVIRLRW